MTALVPDPTNRVPYDLPTNKTRTVIKTKSYKSTGFNEIRFEDMTAKEEIFIHAQKDFNCVMERDETRLVKADSVTRISGNEIHYVKGYNMTRVASSKDIKIAGDYHVAVGGKFSLGSVEQSVPRADQTFKYLKQAPLYGARAALNTEGNYTVEVKGSKSEQIGHSYRIEAMEALELSSNDTLLLYADKVMQLASDVSLFQVAKSITLEAENDLTLKCGEASIKLSGGMISIKGKKVKINCEED